MGCKIRDVRELRLAKAPYGNASMLHEDRPENVKEIREIHWSKLGKASLCCC